MGLRLNSCVNKYISRDYKQNFRFTKKINWIIMSPKVNWASKQIRLIHVLAQSTFGQQVSV